MSEIELAIHPRQSVTREAFVRDNPPGDVALDGYVRGGPFRDKVTLHANFDHHEGVIRGITMSTAKQSYFAIKGRFVERRHGRFTMHINDPDQDTSFATWLLKNYHLFTGSQSHPAINRQLDLNDKLDITGGTFPMNLNDVTLGQHLWTFKPYADARRDGTLATATESTMRLIVEAVHRNLNKLLIGEGGYEQLDSRHEIFYQSPRFGFELVNEIGGNDARYYLLSTGHLWSGYVSLVATRPDGRYVYTIGRPSEDVDYPVEDLYDVLNEAEGRTRANGWNGSDLVGGPSREDGSSLRWQDLRDILEAYFEKRPKPVLYR